MTETGSALRATSDRLVADIEALEVLERRKRELAPGDPQLLDVAAAVEEIARRVLGSSVRQRELSEVAHELAADGAPGAPTAAIEDTPREIHVILADWRQAERRARELPEGSPDAVEAQAQVDRLRDEYRSAHESARRQR